PARLIMSRVTRRLPMLMLAICLALACREREAAPRVSLSPRVPTVAPTPLPELGYIDESQTGAPADGGTIRRRLVGEPATLNAVLQSSLPEQQVLQYLSRNLLDFDSRGELVGGLAESFEKSADGREYSFRLRPQAIWEDGSPVTAADAVFTIRRIHD